MTITTILAIIALVLAIINGFNARVPLWIPVALLALAVIVPAFVHVRP